MIHGAHTPGAYGFRFAGRPVDADDRFRALLAPVPCSAPQLDLHLRVGSWTDGRTRIDDRRGVIPLIGGGVLRIEREPLRATYTTPVALDAPALIHPFLAPAAAVAATWLGRWALHASGFVVDGGAWLVLGGKEAGKTTLALAAHAAGLPVVSDDMIVIDDVHALTSPRALDLRSAPAGAFAAVGADAVRTTRDRWRVQLPALGASTPIAGFVVPEWSTAIEFTPIRPAERAQRLLASRSTALDTTDPLVLFELVKLPMIRMLRTKDISRIASGFAQLVDALRECPPSSLSQAC